jgi:hypothetical protein
MLPSKEALVLDGEYKFAVDEDEVYQLDGKLYKLVDCSYVEEFVDESASRASR